MVITPNNCLSLVPDESYPNIVRGMKDQLLKITEIKGVTTSDNTRRTVTSKVMNRIHKFINTSKGDYMTNLDDIITYLDNVSYVNKTALPIIYMAITGLELPPIVIESYLLNKFVSEGYRSLLEDEKPFFKKMYNANGFFLKKPSFSGSSVVSIDDMVMQHKIENFSTDFMDLLTYIEGKGDIINIGNDYFMSNKAHKAEKFIRDSIDIKMKPIVSGSNAKMFIDPLLSKEQSTAVESILTSTSKIVGLTGKAGTGKTRVLADIVENAALQGASIVCCAFTGKASSRMEHSEIKSNLLVYPPKTIHSLIATLKMANMVNLDLVIIDEASTLNSELFSDLLNVLEHSSTLSKIKFILVGDSNQLPPIGGGQIFEDILTMNLYPVYRLTKIFRTTDESMLGLYDDVLNSKVKVDTKAHKKFFNGYRVDEVGETINKIVDALFNKDKDWHKNNKCIILTHTNKFVDYFNYLCYKKINNKVINFYEYTFDDHPEGIEFDWEPLPTIWVGAKIIFTKNDKIDVEKNGEVVRVNNGTVGQVLGFFDDYVLVESYDDGKTFYMERDYDQVKLAYAMTVFKSQGSEAQFVIYFHSNNIFETKRLAYTAMTRARQNLKIYTPIDGFKMSLDVDRFTNLNSK